MATTTTTTTTTPGTAEEQQQLAAAAAEAQKELDIYENFATPLAGTFLNLPHESVLLKCPACGIKDHSVLQNDLKWWASELNRIVGCLFVTFCCCCCLDYVVPCKQTDRSHYCDNCGCYFGRAMKRRAPLKIKARASQ
ncbi:uncharacterized protein [Drosophila virilis]|uniref:LITAF domain-containing protein n=1 Tax=Drosophila virilis TaxID=7244 RepID=B4LIR2_DROVI|nr:uncharacterized protein LOC6624909 [Drosophila virilis]EDW61415.2 uncharacterized protein Dvir_GJ20315 [Drosophila virilis]